MRTSNNQKSEMSDSVIRRIWQKEMILDRDTSQNILERAQEKKGTANIKSECVIQDIYCCLTKQLKLIA